MRRTLLMIAAVALLLTQCRKPAVELPTAGPANENMVSMTVTVGHGRTSIGTDGAITWSENDKLYVGDGEKCIGYLTLEGTGGSATGTFTGTVSATANDYTFGFYYLGSTADPAVNATEVTVDFSSQNIYNNGGKLEDASKHHVGYGTATGKVEGGNVILNSADPVKMTSKVAIAYFEFKDGETPYEGALTLSGDHIYNKMTVKFNASDFDFTPVKDGNISLAGGHAQRYVMLVPPENVDEETLNFGGGATGTTKLYKGIEANKFYCVGAGVPIEVSVTPKPKFTVGMDDQGQPITVEFAPGNLQYLGQAEEGHKWRFAEHQWDYMGDGPASGTTKQGNVDLTSLGYSTGMYNTGSGEAGGSETDADKAAARDLFGWGATGFQDERTKSTGYQTNYQPYSTSKTTVDGASGVNTYGYGPDFDATNKYGLSVEDKSDWGYLAIGTDPAGTWRTLTTDEWAYLLRDRGQLAPEIGSSTDCCYAEVKVNGVCGLMVFPDVFAWPSDVLSLPSTFNTYSSDWNGVDYSTADFGKLESAGVVFLPAADYRLGSSLGVYDTFGGYWASSCCSNDTPAHVMTFQSTMVALKNVGSRFVGYSVRLVR